MGILFWALRCILSLGFMAVLVDVYTSSVEEKAFFSPSDVCLPTQNIRKVRVFLSEKLTALRNYFRPLFRKVPGLKKLWIPAVLLTLAAGLSAIYQYAQTPPAVHQPLAIGHRGSDLGVENTLKAVEGAIESGADYAEVDPADKRPGSCSCS